MTNKQIRREIENKIKKLGVKGAYKYHVIENAKCMKKQMPINSFNDKIMIANLAHGITIEGFKKVNIFYKFKDLFVSENVIKDEVWDYIIYDLMEVLNKDM